ncbi:hypothetical protein ETB97_010340, partial [Aspergillus alliaceus]
MLGEDMQRLGKELSGLEELSDDEASDKQDFVSQIKQLNVLPLLCQFSPKTTYHDIRAVYSSLFSVRSNNSQDGFDEDSDVVTLRHSSFYEFCRTPIHFNADRAEAKFLRPLE